MEAGQKTPLPSHVLSVDPAGISQVKLIDATPIGITVRSTAATYANVHDELRVFAKTVMPKIWDIKLVIFPIIRENFAVPYVTAPVRSVWDVRFLPDVDIPCPGAEVPDIQRSSH